MSIDITIRQTGLFKKTMPLEVILGSKLKYGIFDDRDRLVPDKLGEKQFLAYLPDCIGRGISVIWNKNEKSTINLRLNNPCAPEEIIELAEMLKRMTSAWKCETEMDGKLLSTKLFCDTVPELCKFNERTVLQFVEKINNGETTDVTISCAMFPLVIGKNEAETFAGNPSAFFGWMTKRQSYDAYYAVPKFFTSPDGETVCKFVVSEDTTSIFPIHPRVPFGLTDENGEQLKCRKCDVMLFSPNEENLGEVPYEVFLKYVAPKAAIFDGNSILFEGLTLEQLKEMRNFV